MTSPPSPAVQLDDVTQTYPRFTLGPINAALSGGVTGLVGANGAGKSTLMRILVGVERPAQGHVVIHGGHNRVGYVPQGYTAPPRQTVEGLLEFAAWAFGMAGHARRAAVDNVIERLDLGQYRRSRFGRLSGGTQRRVAIAQSLVHDPAVLVLDEPTTGLDPLHRVQVRDIVKAEAAARTVLLSSHLGEDIEPVADQVLVLVDGTLAFSGSPAALRALDDGAAPGDTPFERAIVSLLGAERAA